MELKIYDRYGIQDLYKEYETDSGYDVRTPTSGVIEPGESVTIKLGFSIDIPKKHEIQIRPRSGMTKDKILVQLGTIDQSYIEDVGVTIINFSKEPFVYTKRDRLAQMVLVPVVTDSKVIIAGAREVVKNPEGRGYNGFGSTGTK